MDIESIISDAKLNNKHLPQEVYDLNKEYYEAQQELDNVYRAKRKELYERLSKDKSRK